MKNQISFCCATDENFVPNTGAMICSLIKNNPWIKEINIVPNRLSSSSKKELEDLCKSLKIRIRWIELEESLFEGCPLPAHFTLPNYFRLALPEKFAKQSDYIAWLDSDIIIDSDISDMLNYLPKSTILSVANFENQFNAGVLLINTKRYCRKQIKEKAIHYAIKNNQTVDPTLNKIVGKEELITFPVCYNYTSKDMAKHPSIEPKLIHYTGSRKPWGPGCNLPYKKRYFFYLSHTPWKDMRFKKGSILEKVREKAPFLIINLLKRIKYRKRLKEKKKQHP